MARSIKVIHQGMIDDVAASDTLSPKMNSTSTTAIYRLFTFILATAIHLHEVIFGEHVAEVQGLLDSQKTHNRQWYADMAKKFQYGYALVPDKDYYETIDETAQIVHHAAVDEVNGILFMKVARLVDGALSPLSEATPDQFTPFKEYVFEYKDAGVIINFINSVGDMLRLSYKIFYDPLVMDETGQLLSEPGVYPVVKTINEFIQNLPFNGEFVPVNLTDSLQATEGVKIPVLQSCETKFGTNDWSVVDGRVTPNAGYLTIAEENLFLTYTAYSNVSD